VLQAAFNDRVKCLAVITHPVKLPHVSAPEAAVNGAAEQANACMKAARNLRQGWQNRMGALGVPYSAHVLLLWRGLLTTAAAPQPVKLPQEN